jgi:hypothetical protein
MPAQIPDVTAKGKPSGCSYDAGIPFMYIISDTTTYLLPLFI